ncbi:MAG: DMT family transporter [Ardenticatenaceae bacterium]|nr:DMT family transporter [Ardenticatenaceae bacterium]HBY92680.1 EamA family transporter [Chloroflexota bacterium]
MITPAAFRRGLILIVLAAVLWGTTGLTSRMLYRLSAVDALSIGFLRLLIAAPAMLLIGHALAPGSLGPMARRDWRAVALFGLGVAGYNYCFFAAVARTSVTAATLLALCTAPLFVALLARLLLAEPLTRPVVLALAAGLTGTILLVGSQGGHDLLRRDALAGNLLAIGAALSYAGVALVGRAKSQQAAPGSFVALAFAAGLIFLAPVALSRRLSLPTTGPAWLAMLYLSLVPTALAYLIYIFGLRTVPATTSTIGTLVEPLTAALLAALFLGERLPPSGLVGAGLLLSSLAILSLGDLARRRRRPFRQRAPTPG